MSFSALPHCTLTWVAMVSSSTVPCCLPHCRGAVGSGDPVVHYHTAKGEWVVIFF